MRNQTAQPADLPSALDADPDEVASALDAARGAAGRDELGRLPTTRSGLPEVVQVTRPSMRPGSASVPLRLTGRLLTETSGSVTAGGTQPGPDGAAVRGTLNALRSASR